MKPSTPCHNKVDSILTSVRVVVEEGQVVPRCHTRSISRCVLDSYEQHFRAACRLHTCGEETPLTAVPSANTKQKREKNDAK